MKNLSLKITRTNEDEFTRAVDFKLDGKIKMVELIPISEYAGKDTEYPANENVKPVFTTNPSFEIIDPEVENRFTLMCKIENVLTNNTAYIFRDTVKRDIILVRDLGIPISIFNGIVEKPVLSYIKLSSYKGKETVTGTVDTNTIDLHNFNIHLPSRQGDNGLITYNQFISLGSSADLLGDDCTIDLDFVFEKGLSDDVINLGFKKSENVLLPIIL